MGAQVWNSAINGAASLATRTEHLSVSFCIMPFMPDLKINLQPPSPPKLWKYWKIICYFRAVISCHFLPVARVCLE